MSKTVQGNPTPIIPPSQAHQTGAQDSLQAKLDAQGAPPIEPRGLQQTDGVNELLGRAGLQQGVDGSQAVKDTATISRGADGLTAAEQLYGTSQTQIKPPAPPKIELTQDLKLGAEAFAANIDQLANEALFRTGSVPTDNTPKITESTSPFETVNYLLYGNKLGDGLKGDQVRAAAEAALGESQDGIARDRQTVVKGQEAKGSSGFTANQQAQTAVLAQLQKLPGDKKIVFDVATGQPKIDPNITYKEVFSPENVKAVFTAAVHSGGITPATVPGGMRNLSELTADMLLALFLKLNITDPNNSVETHNQLHELSTNLRQQGIQEARDKAKTAQEMMKEAEAYAAKAAIIGKVVMIITIIIMLIITIFTFGAAAPAAAAATGGIIAAIQAAVAAAVQFAANNAVMMIVQALVVMILQIVAATANNEAAQKSADASEAKNDVERARLQAEKEQRVIEEEAAIMKTIMESKNQVVESVIKMLNAMFATQTKVMSAGMTR